MVSKLLEAMLSLPGKTPHAMSILFFLLGATLLLLGLTTGLDIPLAEDRRITVNSRVATIASSSLCLAISILLFMYSRRTGDKTGQSKEAYLLILRHLGEISDTQKHILRILQNEGQITLASLHNFFLPLKEAELFYRMEQLRLLHLVDRMPKSSNRDDRSFDTYRLSSEYRSALDL